MPHCRTQKGFEEHDEEFAVLPSPPNSQELNSIEHLWDVFDKQVQSTSQHTEIKGSAVMPWCQIPQHLLESMPQMVRDILVAQGEPTQCWAGGFDDVTDPYTLCNKNKYVSL